ncbi:hypothetical protein [Novipirellula rosea]
MEFPLPALEVLGLLVVADFVASVLQSRQLTHEGDWHGQLGWPDSQQ